MFFNSGIRGARARDGVGSIASKDQYVQKIEPVPSITSYAIQGSDDQALNPAGGQTVVVTGTGFAAGLTGIVGGTNLASVTVVSPYQATFTSPAAAPGSYTLILSNSSGTAAIYIPGLTYSSIPTYTTAAGSIGTFYETTAVSTQVVATSDSAITYSLASGALPVGSTLYANGVITGTAPVDSSSTTYSFSITATDVELQDVTRSFTLTINTDVVTWTSPTSGTVYTVVGNSPISNVTLSATSAAGYGVTYAANALPTGLTLSSGVISGTPTVESNITSLLTATASTTNRSATNTIYWVVTLNDSFFKYNSLLMSSTVVTNTFATDLSSNNFDITIVGDTKPSKFDPFELGYYSGYFDGSTSKLTFPTSSSMSLDGQFTIECWVYWSGTSLYYQNFIGSNNTFTSNASFFRVWGTSSPTNANKIGIGNPTHDAGSSVFSTNNLVTNTWNHVAATRDGSNIIRVFINGALEKTGSTDSSLYDFGQGGTCIGDSPWDGAQGWYSGYISNLRVLKGTCLYTTAFTPSTTPLTAVANTSLLTCQSSRFVDNSANAFAITVNGNTAVNPFQPFTPNSSYATYGSTLFDGTGDYLSIPYSGLWALTGDFTIECWLNWSAHGSYGGIVGSANSNTGAAITAGWFLDFNATNNTLQFEGQGSVSIVTTNAIPSNQWNHIVVVRSGSTITHYLNGVANGSGTSSQSFNGTNTPLLIGIDRGSTSTITGYISNLRLVKGTAVYTATFTPPTAPLTAIANTSLLTCQTTVPQTTSVFVDESGQNNSITRNGNTNIGTFSPLNGSWSNYFDGTGDYLSIPTNSALDFGSGDFTVEGWVYQTSTVDPWFLISSSGSGGFFFGYSSGFGIGFGRTGIAWDYRDTGAGGSLGTWNHMAVTRSGTSMRIFYNGTQVGTTQTISTAYNLGVTSTTIGSQGALYYFPGYISNVRVVKGTAVYTAAFTPSTTPLNSIANTSLLTCNSPSFVDYSPINNVITRNGDTTVNKFSPFPGYITNFASYSGFFDGTGDYLTVPSNAALQFGTGDFTIEGWIYPTSPSGDTPITASYQTWATSVNFYFALRAGSPNVLIFRAGDSLPISLVGNTSVPINTWTHVAVARSSGVTKIFVNGVVQTATHTGSVNISATALATGIGASQGGLEPFTGYISNIRFVKGTAVYTATFTPPTAPLTAIANTSLLTCQSTTFIDNSANALAITVAGNTKPMIQNPFVNTFTSPVAYSPTTTGSSMYFDGTGDYLTVPASNAFAFGTGNFTVEFWINTTQTTSNATLVNREWGGSPHTGGWSFELNGSSSTAMTIYWADFSTSATFMVANTTSYRDGAWHHVAWVRNGSSFVLYIDGVSVATATNATAFGTNNNQLTIGQDQTFGSGARAYNGYMSNLRIVKTALYTGPFVPSNSPLPAVQNTTLLVSSTITPSVYDAAEISDIETAGTSKLTTSNSPYYSSYSGQFDGTGDYLTVSNSTGAFTFGTGNFTVEAWVYLNAIPAGNDYPNSYWILGGGPFNDNAGFDIAIGSTNLQVGLASFSSLNINFAHGLQAGQWYHIAVVRNSNTLSAYKNGTLLTSSSVTGVTADAMSSGIAISAAEPSGATSGNLNGYISNLRVVKGTAVYTANFTPSTTPLTAISGTSLLTCQSNRFVDNSTNAFAITINGNTLISTLQPFGGSNLTKYSSAYFGTKTDYLGMRPQPGIVTFPGDFTFECWVYPSETTLSTAWGVWDSRQSGGTPNAMVFALAPLASPVAGSWRLSYYNGTPYVGTGTVLYNQWTYVAWVRSGTTMTFYVNGVAGGTATISGTQAGTATTAPVYIGIKDSNLSGYGTLGYIADLRITNGYARYTTTFTPPTVPLLGF